MVSLSAFIESFRNDDNTEILDVILEGHSVIFETGEWDGTVHKAHTTIRTDENEDGVEWSTLEPWKRYSGVNPENNKKLLDFWQSMPNIYDNKKFERPILKAPN
jgi:hypothetical protein